MTSPYADLRARLAPLLAAVDEVDNPDPSLAFNERYRRMAIFNHALHSAYPEIMALLARGEAAEADADRLAVILRTPYPVGAYVRWSRNGNTEDADALNHYEEDREAALRLHDEAVALRERPS